MTVPGRIRLSPEEYQKGILAGNRSILSRAITLVESVLPSDQAIAAQLLQNIMPFTGKAQRLGLTGVPGVGKSTFIDAFGTLLTGKGKKVAVLAVDPSSQISGGSILGDKTRMDRLSVDPMAFIRPSPASGSLGGVSRKTRESLLLCEAAGFDIIIVETVGVGQSEVAVHSMVDFFLLLMLPGAGDELQGIKKGIMEMANGLVINKADGDRVQKAQIARMEYKRALHLFMPSASGWEPQVLTCSSLQESGMEEIWEMLEAYFSLTRDNGWLEKKRGRQAVQWMHESIRFLLEDQFFADPEIKAGLKRLEEAVRGQEVPPTVAAQKLLDLWFNKK